MTTFIRDTEGFTAKVLEELQSSGKIKYVHIESVKLRNPVTRVQSVVKDIYFLSTGTNSNKVWFVCGAQDLTTDTAYMVHLDLTHTNMCNSMNAERVGQYKIFCRPFCNPVDMYRLWKRPEDMKFILKGNLLEGNPNDRWRTPDSVDIDKYIPHLRYISSEKIKSKSTLRQIVTRRETPDQETPKDTLKYIDICNQLEANPSLRYAYVLNGENCLAGGYILLPEEKLDNPRYFVSDYYRVYSSKDIGEKPTINRTECDLGIFGCGSSGSSIIDQCRRLTYFKSVVLVDPDIVEEKNLRNQIYTDSDTRNYKAHSSARHFLKLSGVNKLSVDDIKYYKGKFQDVTELQYTNFKYLVSGFDSFETRIELLDYIKSGKIKTKYLIDIRYKDLTSSLFFIDCEDKSQLEYYEKVLLQDEREYKAIPPKEWDLELVKSLFSQYGVVSGGCLHTARIFDIPRCYCGCDQGYGCGSDECLERWFQYLKEHNADSSRVDDNSCLAQNFIHIYAMTASWVTSVIRAIETDNVKTLTHVELGIDPVPQSMVLKK